MSERLRTCKNCKYWQCTPRFYMNGSDHSQGECRFERKPMPTTEDYWCGQWADKQPQGEAA